MPDDVATLVEARLGAVGQRFTPNRRAVVEALAGADHPLTITELLARRSDLAQSSAYRSLAVLEASRVVRRLVGPGDHARYELTEDLTSHHHHLICVGCGAVQDFAASSGLERRVREAAEEAAEGAGFSPRGHSLDVLGLCAACA